MTLHDDELLNEIGATLDVEPDPDFGVGVHARIRGSRQHRLAVGAALALAASAVLAVGILRRPVEVPTPVLQPRGVPPQAAHAVETPVPTVVAPGLQPRENTVAPAVEPQYVVVTNQLELLQGLWARHKGRPMQEATGGVADAAETVSEPIVIAPVRVLPVVIGESDGLPVGRTPIIRRAIAATEAR